MNEITDMKLLHDGDMITAWPLDIYEMTGVSIMGNEPITKTENRTLFLIVVIYKNKIRTITWFFIHFNQSATYFGVSLT